MGILSIEFEIAEKINFNKVIDTEMASVKARKVKFNLVQYFVISRYFRDLRRVFKTA